MPIDERAVTKALTGLAGRARPVDGRSLAERAAAVAAWARADQVGRGGGRHGGGDRDGGGGARVRLVWAEGQETEATVRNGFFIGRVRATVNADITIRTPPVTVTAYDADGAVVAERARVAFSPLGAPDEPGSG
jgi:hypothetical protein